MTTLTKYECAAVRKELAERVKDLIYSNSQSVVNMTLSDKLLSEYYNDFPDGTTTINITIVAHFVKGDVQQIVNRRRRTK